jgi:predicted transcriptional regulator
MALREWVRLPTDWIIQEGGLRQLRWTKENGSDNVAALMSLAVIAHHAEDDSGSSKLTYDTMCMATGLSRAKVSGGLTVLEKLNIVSRNTPGRSTYRLINYRTQGGWGKLPASGLYRGNQIEAFEVFHLRKAVELNALKLYFLFVAARNSATNLARIGYDKIHDHTGVAPNKIRHSLSLLAAVGLVFVEHVPSKQSEFGISNAYRLAHVDSYKHMGTTGRGMIDDEMSFS